MGMVFLRSIRHSKKVFLHRTSNICSTVLSIPACNTGDRGSIFCWGATNSILNYALRRAARDHERKYGKEVAEWRFLC